MAGFLSKLFGGGKKEKADNIEDLLSTTLEGLLEKSGLDLTFDLSFNAEEEEVKIEFSGDDEELMKEKEGQLIDAIQLFLQRVAQHHLPEDRTKITIDCAGYLEESNQALVDLAEKLKGIVLEKGKSVYFRALPPKDRKVIHQYLASDDRVRSRSVGDGLYKKIKIYPVKGSQGGQENSSADID